MLNASKKCAFNRHKKTERGKVNLEVMNEEECKVNTERKR